MISNKMLYTISVFASGVILVIAIDDVISANYKSAALEAGLFLWNCFSAWWYRNDLI